MALYYVIRQNDYFNIGTFVEDVDDECGMVQEMHMIRTEDKAYRPFYAKGVQVPREKIRWALLAIQNSGGYDYLGVSGCL